MDATAAVTPEPGAVLRLAERPTELTGRVTQIWRTVLERDIETHDNFFDQGGTALDAVLVVSRISTEFGADLPLSTVFDYPTIDEFAAALIAHLTDAGRDDRPGLRTG